MNKNSTISYENINYDVNEEKDIKLRHLNYNFEIYELDVLVDNFGRFIGIDKIRINKKFYDPTKLPFHSGKSVEELLAEDED